MPYPEVVVRGAFVVQLRNVSQREADQMEGLVEEVDTGKQRQFRSEDELIRFIRERLQRSGTQPQQEGTHEPGEHRS